MLRVKFSGSLRQIANCTETPIELLSSRRLADVLEILAHAIPGILGTSADCQMAAWQQSCGNHREGQHH